MCKLLLMSGGIDSTALLYWLRPKACLFVNYGQRARNTEQQRCEFFARETKVTLHQGTLDGGAGSVSLGDSFKGEDKEWIPFRNQFLITFAAWFAKVYGFSEIVIGCVKSDEFYKDGSVSFLDGIDKLVKYQEEEINVTAPAKHLSTTELILESGVPLELLGWCHSCNISDVACGECGSCQKALDILQVS